MSARLWILGAADPEMEAIESLLRECGERVAYALSGSGRVHPASAYRGDSVQYATDCGQAGEPGETWYLVECDVPPTAGATVVRIDHHRQGDPGYGRPPAEFLAASSLGQVITMLIDISLAYSEHALSARLMALFGAVEDCSEQGRERAALIDAPNFVHDSRGWVVEQSWLDEGDTGGLVTYVIPRDLVLCAAADHCPGAAYRDECPGVVPDDALAIDCAGGDVAMITLIHYPPGLQLPAPWQPAWQGSHALDLPSLPRRLVARAPSGTPLPPGAEPYAQPEVTEEHRRAARADIEAATRSRDQLVREIAEGAIDNPGELDRDILAWLGLAHPYALLAPLSVTTLDAACRAMVAAGDEWDSRHSSVVIRTAFPEGFDSWIGIGSLLARVGKSPDYEAAEASGIAAVRALRERTMARVQSEILAGWSPETPYYSATIATAADALPIHVHRGPLTAGELVRVHPSSGVAMPASSWDLPVVAEYRGDGTVIERHDERVTWSDEDSRARQRERQQAGDARRKAEEHRALELLRAVPALAPYLTERGLQRGAEIALGNGMTVVAQGPVRMREDGAVALAQVRDQRTGRTMWMAIGHFA